MSGSTNSTVNDNAENSNMSTSLISESTSTDGLEQSDSNTIANNSALSQKLAEYCLKNPEKVPERAIEKIIEGSSLEEECAKRPFLDGTWFRPHLASSSFAKGVNAECQLCEPQPEDELRLIKGSLHSVSNYKSHIKVIWFSIIFDFFRQMLAIYLLNHIRGP